jgi:hypothetical protein
MLAPGLVMRKDDLLVIKDVKAFNEHVENSYNHGAAALIAMIKPLSGYIKRCGEYEVETILAPNNDCLLLFAGSGMNAC